MKTKKIIKLYKLNKFELVDVVQKLAKELKRTEDQAKMFEEELYEMEGEKNKWHEKHNELESDFEEYKQGKK